MKKPMKHKFFSIIGFCIVLALSICGCAENDEKLTVTPVKVGNPGLGLYTATGEQDNFARSVWDMKAYGGKVYFGSGDFENNRGPVYIGCYDPETDETYIFQDGLNDEQIDRFRVVDGKLIAPGIDPRGYTETHYFELNEDESEFVCRQLPLNNCYHNFDITFFDGKVFMANSTDEYKTTSAVAILDKDGKSFADVEVVFDGKVVNGGTVGGFSRAYDFFEIGGNLYVLFRQQQHIDGGNYDGVYKYDANKNQFLYHSSLDIFSEARNHAYNGKDGVSGFLNYGYSRDSVAVGDKLAICNGYLLVTEDMKDYTRFKPYKDIVFTDIIKVDNTVYILGMRENGADGFTNYVYKSTDLKSFTKVMRFDLPTYMRSMEYIDGRFVFGAGTRLHSTASSDSGSIYTVDFDLTE